MVKMINYGIDLGTTNSAIAVWEDGEARIIKNKYGEDLTPSVVRIDKRGRLYVGKQAYKSMFVDKDNVAGRFKRYIHLGDKKFFPDSKKEMDAVQLSAEVLKSLLSDASQHSKDPITAAVITVPAAFNQLQCEGTANAARLAGLKLFPLLQEPIAASVAVGLRPGSRDKKWLVYDLGGGTFDVALISTKEGRLSILEHKGDNNLGGSIFDEKILENIIIPRLQENYRLPEPNSARYLTLYQKLRNKVEEIKIELSILDICSFVLDENEPPIVEDYYGNPIAIEFDIGRTQIENIVEEYIARTIAMCKNVIESSRVSLWDIERVILVGGPTKMPLVRKMIGELGINLDFSIDPLTIVARGAAVYASSIPIGDEESVFSAYSPGVVNLKLAYERIWPETTCVVAGKVESGICNSSGKQEIRILNKAGYWDSGWIELIDNYFETYVHLLEDKVNQFQIELRNEKGQKMKVQPDSFEIRHGLTISEPPLPHSISIELQRPDGTSEFDVIFPRSIQLPAEKRLEVQTTKTIKTSGNEDYLAIKLWEEITDRENEREFIGALKIGSDVIKRPIPYGSKVELLIRINESRLLTVEAFIPILDQSFDKIFNAKENIARISDQLSNIAEREIAGVYRKLEQMQELTEDPENNLHIDEIWEKVEVFEQDLISTNIQKRTLDPDYDRRIIENWRNIKTEIARVEKEIAIKSGREVEQLKLDGTIAMLEHLVEDFGSDSEKMELKIIKKDIDSAFASKSERRIRKAMNKLNDLKWGILFRQNWFWFGWFEDINKNENLYMDPKEAKQLIQQGEQAYGSGDIDTLRDVMIKLIELIPSEVAEEEQAKALKAGIRKMRL